MATLHVCVANALAGAYVPRARGALGAGGGEPELLLAGWAGAGGSHDDRAAEHVVIRT